MAALVLERMQLASPTTAAAPPSGSDAKLRWVLERVSAADLERSGLLDQLYALASISAGDGNGNGGHADGARAQKEPMSQAVQEPGVDDVNAELNALLEGL
jgi:hypothetical protein